MSRVLLLALFCLFVPLAVQATDCNRPTRDAVAYVELPGAPFTAIPTSDGCWIFVSLISGTAPSAAGVAVLSRREGRVALERTVPLQGLPSGMALTHDGGLLIVPSGFGVAFLDVQRLTTGIGEPLLASWGSQPATQGLIYAAITADDRYLFVSNEGIGRISVIDLAATRRLGFRRTVLIGTIVVGSEPVGLAFSTDQRYLFATSQSMRTLGWPLSCRPETNPRAAPDHAEGALVVIDLQRAVSEPATTPVVKFVKAGCNPVRVVTSPRGGRVYVTARGSDALLMFDENDLTRQNFEAVAERVHVGTAPVGVAVLDEGRRVVVTNSDRFGNATAGTQSLYVIDPSQAVARPGAILGLIPTKAFPREIRSTADGRTLLVTNCTGRSLEIVDMARTPWVFSPSHEQPRETSSGGRALLGALAGAGLWNTSALLASTDSSMRAPGPY